VVDWVALGAGFSPITSVSPVSIIPLGLHTYLHLHAAPAEEQTGDAREPSKINVVSEIGELWIEK